MLVTRVRLTGNHMMALKSSRDHHGKIMATDCTSVFTRRPIGRLNLRWTAIVTVGTLECIPRIEITGTADGHGGTQTRVSVLQTGSVLLMQMVLLVL